MTNRFPGKNCVLCPNLSIGVGEHVWPSWLIKKFRGQGPFYTDKNGETIMKRSGETAHEVTALLSVHVPMCGPCNTRLSSTVEIPAKDIIERIAPWNDQPSWPSLNTDESAALARWFLKVALLTSHPEADHDNPKIQNDPAWTRFGVIEPAWLDWMRTGSAPPKDFSVFATRRLVEGEQPHVDEELRLMLPSVAVDGEDLRYMVRSIGFRGFEVTIVWHPGWPIRHPLVETGRAAQLWPSPNAVDFSGLPEVNPEEFKFQVGLPMTFTEGSFIQASSEPLTVETELFKVPFGELN